MLKVPCWFVFMAVFKAVAAISKPIMTLDKRFPSVPSYLYEVVRRGAEQIIFCLTSSRASCLLQDCRSMTFARCIQRRSFYRKNRGLDYVNKSINIGANQNTNKTFGA